MIRDAMQDNKIGNIMDPTKFSRNYKMGSVEGNVIFEGNSYLPKEAMLEMTLRAFGYDIDMMEVNIFIVSSLSCVSIYFLEVATLKKKICVTSTDWHGGHRIRAHSGSPVWKERILPRHCHEDDVLCVRKHAGHNQRDPAENHACSEEG